MLVIKQFGPVTYAMGTLQEILAGTGIAAKVRALPNDAAGCTLEMSASGWVGCLGVLTSAQFAALSLINVANYTYINFFTGATIENGLSLKRCHEIRQSNGLFLGIGDSITCGYGAVTANPKVSGSWFNAGLKSVFSPIDSVNLNPCIESLGIPPSVHDNYPANDSRWTYGSGWSLRPYGFAGDSSSQGASWNSASGATGTLTFSTTELCDAFDVYFATSASMGIASILATGSSSVTFDASKDIQRWNKIRVPCESLAKTNSVAITVTSGILSVYAIEAVNQRSNLLRIGNAGVGGSTTAVWVNASTSYYKTLYGISALAPSAVTICFGANDASSGVTVDTFMENLKTIISQCAPYARTIIIVTQPLGLLSASAALELQYAAAIRAYVATVHNIYLCDILNNVFNNSYQSNYMSPDGIHPNSSGYAAMAEYFKKFLACL